MRAGFWEILLIVILVLILFGHSKIPDLMKNLANGLNVFKKEIKSGAKDTAKKSGDSEKAAASSGGKKIVRAKAGDSKKKVAQKTTAKKQTAKNK